MHLNMTSYNSLALIVQKFASWYNFKRDLMFYVVSILGLLQIFLVLVVSCKSMIFIDISQCYLYEIIT